MTESKIPSEPGWYWATPDHWGGERELVKIVPYVLDPGLAGQRAGAIERWDLHLWSDWHGPIVETCEECEGKGEVPFIACDQNGQHLEHDTCLFCGGSGRRGK